MIATDKDALATMLLAFGDDELILGHRNSEWTGHAPILEEDIAFANIALDELGHARLWYEQHAALTGRDVDRLIFFRDAGAYRNVRLVELPRGDWAFSMLRQYLFDTFELVRAEQLMERGFPAVAEAAHKIRQEELYHTRHTKSWVVRLAMGTEESHRRTQAALNAIWPYAAQLFQPLPDEDRLVAAGIIPPASQLQDTWEKEVLAFLTEATLQIGELPPIPEAGRTHHTPYLSSLLEEMQQVARYDPEAEW